MDPKNARSFFISLLGLCAISAFALEMPAHAALIDKTAAIVNNEAILLSDARRFERTLGLRRELDPLFGFSEELEAGKLSNSKVLDFLVQERLIAQNFKVTDSEVEQEIQTVQRNNNLNREQLVDFLKAKGFSFPDYYELMRVGLSKRNLLDKEIRTRVNISEEDKRNYFYNNVMKNSKTPLEYNLQLIMISNKSYKTPKAALEAAQNALRSIKQGESFAEVAKSSSDHPSARQGGTLDYISSEQLGEPLRSEARKLAIGAVSDVIKTSDGHLIVKLLDARSTESQKYKEMKDQIEERLARVEYKKQLFIWAERARNDAYVRLN
ncbi:MAG: peptidylprolyl isomerase [Bdellovibrionota bacterium]